MSEQNKPYTLSKEDRADFHDVLDKILDAGDARGFMMLCCTFQQNGATAATCSTGTLKGDDVIKVISTCGGQLLERMAQRCAETPPSGRWQ